MPLTIHKKMAISDFIPKSMADETAPPTFQLKPLTGAQKYAISNELYRNDAGKFVLTEFGVRKVLEWGVTGWQNVVDSQGAAIDCSLENKLDMDAVIIDELVNEIWTRSTLSGDEAKNS